MLIKQKRVTILILLGLLCSANVKAEGPIPLQFEMVSMETTCTQVYQSHLERVGFLIPQGDQTILFVPDSAPENLGLPVTIEGKKIGSDGQFNGLRNDRFSILNLGWWISERRLELKRLKSGFMFTRLVLDIQSDLIGQGLPVMMASFITISGMRLGAPRVMKAAKFTPKGR